jgi:hypothetical protein
VDKLIISLRDFSLSRSILELSLKKPFERLIESSAYSQRSANQTYLPVAKPLVRQLSYNAKCILKFEFGGALIAKRGANATMDVKKHKIHLHISAKNVLKKSAKFCRKGAEKLFDLEANVS